MRLFFRSCQVESTSAYIHRAVQGEASLETRHQYDDAGNILKTRDPLSHFTTFDYSDNWSNATCAPAGYGKVYLKSAANALGQVTSYSYNSCTGTIASTTDPNNQTTTFTYDPFDRADITNFPDGGQTDNDYDDDNRIVTTKTKRTASAFIVKRAHYDRLGRVWRSELCEDGTMACLQSVNTYTEFDALGRVSRGTNPTRCQSSVFPESCAGELTFGVSKTKYDALNRATRVIPPDGNESADSNVVRTSYSGNSTTVTDQAGRQRRSFTDALGRLIEVDEPAPAQAAPGTGSATISGSEQSSGGTGPTPGTGSVTISGSEQSAYVNEPIWDCVLWFDGACVEWGWVDNWQLVYDSGTVSITVNGVTKSTTYGYGSTANSVASALATAINADSNYPATAVAVGAVVNLTSKATGSSSNYSLSAYSSTSDPNFSAASFVPVPSGSTLTGGGPGSGATYDTGSVWVTVNGSTKTVTYGQSSTAATLASALNNAINSDGSYPVSSSLTGSTLTLTAKSAGASTNYSLSGSSSTSQPGTFSQPSFSVSVSGSTLTGGTDAGTGSLATPAVTLYTYDTLDNLTQVLQSGSRPRTFTYNSLSQLLTATNPESGTISYTYDADGNLLTKVSPAPNQTNPAVTVTTTFTYDVLHRLNQKSYSDTTPLVKYSYDGVAYLGCTSALSTSNSIGRRTAMCDGAGQESWSYDVLGRVLTDRRTTNSVTKDFTYAYNFDSSLASLTFPNNRVVTYAYNAAGRALSAVDTANSINYAQNASYAPHGALSSVVHGQVASGFGGITLTQTYNNRLQPATIVASSSNGTVLDFTYGFNAGTANNGNVASIANNRSPNRSQSFTYDELNRIKTAQSAAASGADCWGLQFGYDIWANLLSAAVTKCSAPPLNLGVNTKNQINNTGFQYDAAGNLTFDGSLSATYDAENRIISTNAGVTYSYDGDGKRVKKSNGKLYWYGTGADTLEESDLAGTASADYIFFGGKRTARLDLPGATVHYYFANHLGSTSVVTNSAGTTIEDESDYYPFGGERVVTNTDPNQYKFTGKERDTESGLDFFIARYYSSQYGRFLSPDEFTGGPVDAFSSGDPLPPGPLPYADIFNPQSLNKYAHTYNNPLVYVDRDGHNPWVVAAAVALGAAAGYAIYKAWTYFTEKADEAQKKQLEATEAILNNDDPDVNQKVKDARETTDEAVVAGAEAGMTTVTNLPPARGGGLVVKTVVSERKRVKEEQKKKEEAKRQEEQKKRREQEQQRKREEEERRRREQEQKRRQQKQQGQQPPAQ